MTRTNPTDNRTVKKTPNSNKFHVFFSSLRFVHSVDFFSLLILILVSFIFTIHKYITEHSVHCTLFGIGAHKYLSAKPLNLFVSWWNYRVDIWKAETTIVKPFNILYVLTKAYAELMGFYIFANARKQTNIRNIELNMGIFRMFG